MFLLLEPGSHSESLALVMSLSKTPPALKTAIVIVGSKYEWTEKRLNLPEKAVIPLYLSTGKCKVLKI